MKKSCRNEMGLTYLPQGRAYYEYLVQSSTGSGLSIHSIQNRIQAQLLEDASVCRQILQQYPSTASLSTDFVPTDPAFILLDLQQKMAEDFPSIPDTEYQLKYVDDALSPYLSPAFYLTAPVDAPDQNVIYLNPLPVTADWICTLHWLTKDSRDISIKTVILPTFFPLCAAFLVLAATQKDGLPMWKRSAMTMLLQGDQIRNMLQYPLHRNSGL
ncbi:MAG: DUF885 family protein [Lachnospiraceae bacterium]